MAGTIISGTYGVGITLSSPTYNPATVTGLIDIGGGIALKGPAGTEWAIDNTGTIESTGSAGYGIALAAGGSVDNASAALIYGSVEGVRIYGSAGSITNAGSIEGKTGPGNNGTSDGLMLNAGGTVSNTAAGFITGYTGILAAGGMATIVNSGGEIFGDFQPIAQAFGGSGFAVFLSAGGAVSNIGSGAIVGAFDGIFGAAGTVVNQGNIQGIQPYGSGVYFYAAGAVSNAASAAITGSNAVVGKSGLTLANQGLIDGFSGDGVQLQAGGTIDNAIGGTIAGYRHAISAIGAFGSLSGPGTVVNDGTIAGTGDSGYGIYLTAGGFVSNQSAGLMTGQNAAAIDVKGDVATVDNAGQISATLLQGVGINLAAGGTVSNAAGGTIVGYAGIVTDTGLVVNAGSIAGTHGAGIELWFGGTVVNDGNGMIAGSGPSGAYYGVVVQYGSGTVANAGTIAATGTNAAAVLFAPSYANLLVVDPGSDFIGQVDGGNTAGSAIVSTLKLASAASSGTLSGLGSQFVNFGSIEFDPGAKWTIGGDAAGLAGTISGFAPGDTIGVSGFSATGSDYAGGILTLSAPGGTVELQLPGTFTISDFDIASVGGVTDVTLNDAPCFRAGTRIATERGDVPVEALRPGELVATLAATGARWAEVIWLGYRSIDCLRHSRPHHVWPIRVAVGAFGPGRPYRDLWLSPDHAVFIDEVLIPVKHLVNGRTITRMPVKRVTYHHVELARHAVLLAEGLPAESYLDTGDRGNFANGGGATRLFADFATSRFDVAAMWEAKACAPLIVSGRELTAVRHWVNGMANSTPSVRRPRADRAVTPGTRGERRD